MSVSFGALVFHEDDSAENKQIYVTPEARRFGAAREILRFPEASAKTLGYHAIRLETGILRGGAMKLYQSEDYAAIDS
ncbi:MAG: GNAT superfamily N-acetyltransferase [Planctomycetota bacterium]